jgi:hypothetical protein
MAKDRFNRQKPVYWNKNFKETGSFERYKEPNKKEPRSRSQQNKLLLMYEVYKPVLSNWDIEFLKSVISLPFKLSPKQKQVVITIMHKHPEEMEAFFKRA